jgi:hypothetical protein
MSRLAGHDRADTNINVAYGSTSPRPPNALRRPSSLSRGSIEIFRRGRSPFDETDSKVRQGNPFVINVLSPVYRLLSMVRFDRKPEARDPNKIF